MDEKKRQELLKKIDKLDAQAEEEARKEWAQMTEEEREEVRKSRKHLAEKFQSSEEDEE